MLTNRTELYKLDQIRELERLAVEEFSIPEDVLMERAGQAAYDLLVEQFPESRSVVVVTGSGNNGGDGFVLARLAYQDGVDVRVVSLVDPAILQGAALQAALAYQALGGPIIPFDVNCDLSADVIVDAILGIGLKDTPRNLAQQAIELINKNETDVFSIDVPSGLNVDTGYAAGAVVSASVTITFIAMKQGLLTGHAVACCGDIFCDDLSLPENLFTKILSNAYRMDLETLNSYLPLRVEDAHKGQFGHVVIIGGDYGMAGAVGMAAMAALRVGAGLVSVVTQPEHVPAIIALQPEIMCYGVRNSQEITSLLAKANVIVLGPGMSKSLWSQELFQAALKMELPMVVDAGALHWIAETKQKYARWILTPHPGEASILLNTETENIQADRFIAIERIQRQYGGVAVLKGAGTLIQVENELPVVCTAGNPGMATAGMGDVLSGVLGSLIGQGLSLWEAAQLGVCLHSYAGDLAAAQGERGTLATDLLPFLRKLANPV